ncbi:MAG: hypothetical protein ABIJ21_09010 [Nanoarchaeota archaeon]
MFRDTNILRVFLEKEKMPYDLDDLLELATLNHIMYEGTAKVIISKTATDAEIAKAIDGLFLKSPYNTEGQDIIEAVKNRFPDHYDHLTQMRSWARQMIAERQKIIPDSFVLIGDTMRESYRGEDFFWLPLQKNFGETIEARLEKQSPSRPIHYIRMLRQFSREAGRQRESQVKCTPYEKEREILKSYIAKVNEARKEFHYDN